MSNYQQLFSPWTLGGIPLRNRLAHASILTHFAKDGRTTDKLLNYLASRAEGGAGMIVTEPLAMLARVPSSNRVHAYADHTLPELSKLVAAVEAHGTRLIGQIQDPGRGRHEVGRNEAAIGASALPDDLSWTVPHVLSTAEINALIEEWASSCQRLQRAGFSGVEISAGHGHLFHQFLSSHANKRQDEFGGDLLGRTRFVIQLIERIRGVCGRPFIIGIKLPADDSIKGSIDLQEAENIARLVSACGELDYWTFAWGGHSDSLWTHLPGAEGPRAPYLPAIKRLRSVAPEIPSGALGYITDPNEAETALTDGTADIVFLGRALIADPAWGEKARLGKENEIRYCVSCNTCWRATVEGGGVACDNNPLVGQKGEAFWRPARVNESRRIVVVGAGVAGLEVAWVAATRGHSVTLVGRTDGVGGKTRVHADLPGGENLSSVYDYQYLAGQRAGVQFLFNQQASLQDILALAPDTVVLATGATMSVPDFIPPEYVSEGVITDIRQLVVDLASSTFKESGTLVLVDKDHTEMTYAAAEFLAERFERVIVVTPRDRIASDCSLINRQKIYTSLHRSGVRIITSCEPTDLDSLERGVLPVRNIFNGDIEKLDEVAAITYSTARHPNDALAKPLEAAGYKVVRVGDCFAPRSLLASTAQGLAIGCEL
ncbi:MAG: 2,4-dienoyl-CoA reductase-like NADH-dependent reductase (Old Yellow Enzyme family) [Glaciecola sp.]|jgi:2,4-dienoyl-CoA reductase-like NADH-dependent reductase (Old Yellow Enzyme family)/thioredoxin reductase|uniref:oxidoreductase n=1 Tax=Congregibacter sp. TaxID=2744308 RepID=UPI0039E32732